MQNKLMNYKKSLVKNFIDVKNELYGLNTLISEYICDESGCISETLIDEFIDELCSIRMNKYWHHQYYGISGARTRLLETLLYLSIMAHQNDSKVETEGLQIGIYSRIFDHIFGLFFLAEVATKRHFIQFVTMLDNMLFHSQFRSGNTYQESRNKAERSKRHTNHGCVCMAICFKDRTKGSCLTGALAETELNHHAVDAVHFKGFANQHQHTGGNHRCQGIQETPNNA